MALTKFISVNKYQFSTKLPTTYPLKNAIYQPYKILKMLDKISNFKLKIYFINISTAPTTITSKSKLLINK